MWCTKHYNLNKNNFLTVWIQVPSTTHCLKTNYSTPLSLTSSVTRPRLQDSNNEGQLQMIPRTSDGSSRFHPINNWKNFYRTTNVRQQTPLKLVFKNAPSHLTWSVILFMSWSSNLSVSQLYLCLYSSNRSTWVNSIAERLNPRPSIN